MDQPVNLLTVVCIEELGSTIHVPKTDARAKRNPTGSIIWLSVVLNDLRKELPP